MRGLPSLPRAANARSVLVSALRGQSTSSPSSLPENPSPATSPTAKPPANRRRHVTLRDRRRENKLRVLQNLAFNIPSGLTTEGEPSTRFRPSTKILDPAPPVDDFFGSAPEPFGSNHSSSSSSSAYTTPKPVLKSTAMSYEVPLNELREIDKELRNDMRHLPRAKSNRPRAARRPRRHLPLKPTNSKDDSEAIVNAGQESDPHRAHLAAQPSPLTIKLEANVWVEAHAGYLIFNRRLRRGDPYAQYITYPRLRDVCGCQRCKDPSTRQRNDSSGSAYESAKKSGFLDSIPPPDRMLRTKLGNLAVKWDDCDGPHLSHYKTSKLKRATTSHTPRDYVFGKHLRRLRWGDSAQLELESRRSGDALRVPFSKVHDSQGAAQPSLQVVLNQLHRAGIAIITGVPTSDTDNKTCSLRAVAESIGEIRNTFYGETWDVKSMENSKNIAYTSVNLGLHMDLLYFSEPPRFQLLHCLRNRVEGGASYFTDSFAAASDFLAKYPEEYNLLRSLPLDYEYDNDGHYLHHRHTVFPNNLSNLKAAVNWSPPFQGRQLHPSPVFWEDKDKAASNGILLSQSAAAEIRFYRAIALWEEMLNDPARRYTFTMKEGDLVLFDNRRVLHARTAFRDLTDEERRDKGMEEIRPGEPSRWLKGCYLDGEVVWDKLWTQYKEAEE